MDSAYLLKISNLPIEEVFTELKTSRQGLSQEEAGHRLALYGKNAIAREKPLAWYWMILNNFKNPFILVLLVLGFVSFMTEDI